MKQRSKGFTLLELMIVVAIVGILAAVAIPSYNSQIQKARRADALNAVLDCAAVQARNFTTGTPPVYLNDTDARAAGLCNNMQSQDRFYNLTISNPGCPADAAWCFVVTATPVGGSTQANDLPCASFSIDHRNRKTALDDGGNDATMVCWRTS